jgi:hypothetical protein
MTERLPHLAPRSNAAPISPTIRRTCKRCGKSKPMKGGRTVNGGRTWFCADCNKGGSNEPGSVPVHRHSAVAKVGP